MTVLRLAYCGPVAVSWELLRIQKLTTGDKILFAGLKIFPKRPGLSAGPCISCLCLVCAGPKCVTPLVWGPNRPPGPESEGKCLNVRLINLNYEKIRQINVNCEKISRTKYFLLGNGTILGPRSELGFPHARTAGRLRDGWGSRPGRKRRPRGLCLE